MKFLTKASLLTLAIVVAGAVPVFLYPLLNVHVTPTASLRLCPMAVPNQWLAVLTAFVMKPVYMIISFGLIVALWKQRAIDLAALRWGLIIFWLGENACSTNFLVFGGRSDFWEFLHNYGMTIGFSFVIYATMEAADTRIIKYSAPKERCAMLGLCRSCIKYSDVPCRLRRLFSVMLPATILVATIPLFANLKEVAYNTNVLGNLQTYSQPLSCQFFESRYCPILGILLLIVSWLILLFKKHDPVTYAKIPFAAGLGFLSFGLMRLFFFSVFSDNLLWFVEWEEFTELLFTIAVSIVLWLFRDALFRAEIVKQ